MIPNEGVMTIDTVNVLRQELVEKEEEEEEGQEVIESGESIDHQVERNDKWKFTLDQILVKSQTISLDNCVYRGEGNANVVVSLPHDRKVVRFRKSSSSGEASPDGGRARTTREVEFLKYVIFAFLDDYIEPPEALRVTREDMIRMSEDIRSLRPEYRRLKEIVEEYATIFTDYAFLRQRITNCLKYSYGKPTFCVEIKPKQGFRHDVDDKFEKCTYCLTQYYKLESGPIKSRSSYCPLDLFSGDVVRMRKSIRGLINSPQNNFKIFKDGIVVYDCNSNQNDLEIVFTQCFGTSENQTMEQKFDIFFNLVSKALLRQFYCLKEKDTPNHRLQEFVFKDFEQRSRIDQEIVDRAERILRSSGDRCNFTRGDVPTGSVLGRILNMQQLPYHSADIVYKIYSKHFATLNDEAVYSKMIKMYRGENKASVTNGAERNQRVLTSSKVADSSINFSKLARRISDTNGNESNSRRENGLPSFDSCNNNKETKPSISDNELLALENYLLVTTAKDCSILIAFQEIDSEDIPAIPENFIVRVTDSIDFAVNVGVLDLDPKSIHCVEKHRQRDTNVLVSLTSLLEREIDFRNQSPFGPA